MNQTKILKILNKGLIAGVLASALSFIVPIIPCTKAPVIANPEYKFAFCKLANPFQEQIVGVSTKYFSQFTEPLAGLILEFFLFFALVSIILAFFKKSKGKVLDLTEKK
ncbi:hypothetical protein HOD75_00080 [archaeon]|jgi:hypothetical protein|nr:hypothetical protein [Candidatus Woesearchaeota archaeon]MBT4136049.1 hypothetical protein [archaeon]MBT4241274.1 hypothetical protein [archaeon]MBT4418096.1 hypothetical protein [archaeon]